MKKRTLAALIFALVLMLVVPVVATTVDTAPAAEEVPVLDVAAKNLSLNNTIDLVFYVTVENGNAADARLMTWTAAQQDYAYGTEEKILEPTTVTTYTEKPCAIFYYTGLAAKQMADDVYVRAYVEQDGEKYFSDADKYSNAQRDHDPYHRDTAGTLQRLFLADGHKPQHHLGPPEVAQAPSHHGEHTQQTVIRGSAKQGFACFHQLLTVSVQLRHSQTKEF